MECLHLYTTLISTYSKFNIFSGSLIESLNKPWHLRVSTTWSFISITLLSIPKWPLEHGTCCHHCPAGNSDS